MHTERNPAPPPLSSKRRQIIKAGALMPLSGFATTPVQASNTPSSFGIEGQKAPEIKLDDWIDAQGNPTHFSVRANRGKWIFLKCFQSGCPGCHAHGFPTLQLFAEHFHNHPKVAVAAIQTVFESFDNNSLDQVRRWQSHYQLPIIMGHDPGNEATGTPPQVMQNYRTGGTPWLILIAPDGRVVFNDFHVKKDKLVTFIRQQVA